MNFVTWSIRNPIPVALLFGVLMLLGIVSFPKLPVIDMPEINFPAITINVSYPGVQPSQLETEVTRRIEDAITSVVGVRNLRSTVSHGLSNTVVEFQLERDMSDALDDVRDAITRIRNDLPADANEPVVSRVVTTGRPIISFSLRADNLSETELSWFVDLTVSREISAINGVGSVKRVGGVDREIRVDLDFDRLAALGITAADVSRQLRRVQAEYPGGDAEVGTMRQSIRTVGTFDSPAQLAELPITLPDGRTVRLDTLAEIHDQPAERQHLALLDGEPVVGFEVVRARGSSALAVADAVRERVAEMQQQYPHLQFQEITSTVEHIRESFGNSMRMLLEGALLAVVVVWFFLRDWRATLIAAVALPLSIVPTFWAMDVLGYTLNNLTLLALSLVVGVLVDDAIVEIENIVRHLREGKPPLEAARDAALEIGLPVIATTFTICAVFMPVAFMSGIAGEFFGPFGFTATVSVLFSLLVARMLTPLLASRYLKPHAESNTVGPVLAWYLRCVRQCLHYRKLTLSVSALLIGLSIALVPLIPKAFAGEADQGFIVLAVELPPGARLEQTRAVAETIRQRLMARKDIVRVFTSIGQATSDGFSASGGSVRKAELNLVLTPRSERKFSQQEIQREILQSLRDVPGVRLSLSADWASKAQLTFASEDPDRLAATITRIERELRELPGIGQVSTSASLMTPEILIRPLPDRAAELGVSTEAIATVARFATSGDVETGLAKFNLPNRQLPIRVRASDATRSDIDLIRLLPVPGSHGPVPLASVAEITLDSGPVQISRYDRGREVTLEIDLNGQPLGDLMAKIRTLPAIQNLPAGVREISVGQAEFMVEIFAGFAGAMLIGVLCIYLVLVLLFKEFMQPITILSALPPSAAGAMIGLYVLGFSLSVPSLIGILMLMGIVTKNSILLVEYAERARRDHGLGRTQALMEACTKRARPIVMTTIAMTAGMIPVALGLSTNSDLQSSMGAVVISGLLVSTALSLFVVPVVFTFIDDVQNWLLRRPREVETAPA